MATRGLLYSWNLGQSRTETTREEVYDHATAIAISNPTRSAKFFDVADEPAPLWIAEDYGSAHGASGIATVMADCAVAGTVPQFTLYSIPGRDGSGFSSGGSEDSAAYRVFATAVAAALPLNQRSIWVIEPDAIPKMYAMSGGIPGAAATERKADIAFAVAALRARGVNTRIYLNVGNSNFRSAAEIVGIIDECGIANCDGVSLNVAQTQLIDDEYDYFLDLQALEPLVLGCVINTHLCGRGPYVRVDGDRSDAVYINPPIYGSLDGTNERPNRPTNGVAMGPRPTTKMDVTSYPGLHGLLWTKFPGGSDGNNPTIGDIPDKPTENAPDPGDLYPDYLEAAYDAAVGLDFSAWAPVAYGGPCRTILVSSRMRRRG